MEYIETIINAEESGERIDALLARNLPDFSRSQLQKLLEQGAVTIKGKALKKNYRCNAGDEISIVLPELQDVPLVPQDIPLDVVFEDRDVIVVNKPRGLVVHPAPGHPDGTLVNALLAHCGDSLSGVGGERRPGIVHGTFKNDTGTVDAPIGRDPKNRQRMAVTDKNARPAVTHWEVLARYERYTYIRCRLETGRTHQIRVHMARIGHPLLGDTVYGGRRDKGLSTQCLHARGLKFIHPSTGEPVELWTELPDWFLEAKARLGDPIG